MRFLSEFGTFDPAKIMQIYGKIKDITAEYKHIAVALGMFDGMHRGHQSIVRRALELAKAAKGTAAVFTFANHPLSVVAPRQRPLAIGDSELKADILAAMGVDVLFNINFTREFSRLAPEKFLTLLSANLAPEYVVTGMNYTFGAGGKGTTRMLSRLATDYGFEAEICPTVLSEGRAISSTRIRELIKNGDLFLANEFLGRPFAYTARVIHGDRRGRALGFPTANLPLDSTRVMLPPGVYAARAVYEGRSYPALVNIGLRPTFEGREMRLEVNLQNFGEDIYDRLLRVDFLAKLRDERKFGSAQHLIRQLKRDREAAALYWQKSE